MKNNNISILNNAFMKSFLCLLFEFQENNIHKGIRKEVKYKKNKEIPSTPKL